MCIYAFSLIIEGKQEELGYLRVGYQAVLSAEVRWREGGWLRRGGGGKVSGKTLICVMFLLDGVIIPWRQV